MITQKQTRSGNEGFIPVLLLIVAAILVLGGGVYYYLHLKSSPTGAASNNTTAQDNTSKYATLVHNDAHTIVLNFTAPVNQKDLVGNNIERCIDISVTSEVRGITTGELPVCTSTIAANNFSLSYEEQTRMLTISDTSNPSTWTNGDGPFRIGCADCRVFIHFANIHTPTGDLLPGFNVSVPYKQN